MYNEPQNSTARNCWISLKEYAPCGSVLSNREDNNEGEFYTLSEAVKKAKKLTTYKSNPEGVNSFRPTGINAVVYRKDGKFAYDENDPILA